MENTWKVITHLKCVCGEYTGEKSIATGVGLNPHDEIFNQKWEGYDETVKEMVEERMENGWMDGWVSRSTDLWIKPKDRAMYRKI